MDSRDGCPILVVVHAYRALLIFIFFSLILAGSVLNGQSDSSTTVFQKGKWLLGLTGTISSGSVRSDSSDAADYTLEYSLRLSGSRFVGERIAVGGFLRGERDTPVRYDDRETESMLIGPEGSYYFSKARLGSMFVKLGVGYSRFYDESQSLVAGQLENQIITGQGVGILGTFGYAVVVADKIVFELGLDSLTSWIWADLERDNRPTVLNEKLRTSQFAFSFGFKVLL